MKKRLFSLITLLCILCSLFVNVIPVHADGWILASQLPPGTEVTNRKWTYTQKETTTSTSSSLSGWTQTGKKHTSTTWGDWSSYSDTKRTASETETKIRQVKTKEVKDKTYYNYFRWASSETGGSGSDKKITDKGWTKKYTYQFTVELNQTGTQGNYSKGYRYYYKGSGNPKSGTSYSSVWAADPYKTYTYKTQYSYRDGTKNYTYNYERTVNKESSSYPSGSGIGNVQEWVTYQYKSYYLDLNGLLDGRHSGDISGYGTADVFINGTLVANDVPDYYATLTYGTKYKIDDIKPAVGHKYNGESLYSGEITKDTSVELSFDNVTPYTVEYDANGGTNAPGNQTKIYNQDLVLTSDTPTRIGYIFEKWNTEKNGGGTSYEKGITYDKNANIILYAQWKANEFTVEYNGNGAEGSSYPKIYTFDGNNVFQKCNFSRKGYTFIGWALNADGSGTIYQPEEKMPNLAESGTVQVYAIWEPNHYIIHYDANGGFIYDDAGEILYDGDIPASMQDSELIYGELPLKISDNQYHRYGYRFKGWNTEENKSAASLDIEKGFLEFYAEPKTDGSMAEITLYAVWKEIDKTKDVDVDEHEFFGGKTVELYSADKAPIYYTLDGTEPTTDSDIYTEPLVFDEIGNTVIKAFALKEGYMASQINEYTVSVGGTGKIKYELNNTDVGKELKINLEDKDESDYRIYYNLDDTEPTLQSKIYDETLQFNKATEITVKAFAVEKGCIAGETSNITISVEEVDNPQIKETDNWPGGTMIKISNSTPNSLIYYTTDGSDPLSSKTRKQYGEEFEISIESDKPENLTIRAVAQKNGYETSNVISETFIISDRAVQEPYVALNNVIGGKMVTLGCETDNVEIFYTIDGNDVVENNSFSSTSRPYTGEFLVSEDTTIKAIAVYNDTIKSEQMERSIEVPKMTKPTIDVEVGEEKSVVVIKGTSTNSTIYYTLDGTMPNTNSLIYNTRFEVTQKTKIYAVASRIGYATSDPAEAEAIVLTVPLPVVSTDEASNINSYGAKLHGEILVGEKSGISSRRFIYYEKNNFKSINTIDADESFNAVLSNLKPNTEYWYQAIAENKKGVGTGVTKSFRTAGTPVEYPTSVKLSPEFVSMNKGDKRTVLATVLPNDAINRKLMWSSSNSNIVTVNNKGVLTAKNSGTAIITATAMSGKVKGTMQVAVIDGTINGELDFSEISMAKNVSELWNKNNASETFKVDGVLYGGNSVMATAYLARWGGTVLENRDPYPQSVTDMNVRQYSSDYHVQEVLFLPPRKDAMDNDDIKKTIVEYGAVYAEFQYDSNYFNTRNGYLKDYFLADENSPNAGGHAVVIVGWDDDYSRFNFKHGYEPEGNGAFICKNSWGTEEIIDKKDRTGKIIGKEVTPIGDDGYFYISYYDPYIGKRGVNAVFNNLESNSNYNTIYQYDPLGPVLPKDYLEGQIYVSNVFPRKEEVLKQDELLRAVSFYTGDKGYAYEIYVIPEFTNDTFFDNIGNCVASGVMEYAGYHTVELDKAIQLKQGTRFAVIVRITSTEGKVSTYFEAPLEKMAAQNAYAEEGESYISIDGQNWSDVHLDVLEDTNVCVKAFTDRQGDDIGLTAAIENESKAGKVVSVDEALKKGFNINQDFIDEINKVSLFEKNDQEFASGAISPSIVIGNNTIDVTEGTIFDRKFDLRAQGHSVSPVKNQGGFNTCWAFAAYASLESCVMRNAQKIKYYDGIAGVSGDTAVLSGNVDIPVSKIELNKQEINIAKGKSLNLFADVSPYNATNRSVVWSSNNPDIAQVDTSGSIRALAEGEATITAINTESRKQAVCNVTVTEPQTVTGIDIPYDEIVCEEGDDIIVLHEVLPDNAENTNVRYEISDNEVAMENDGIISAMSAGETEVTISTVEGNYSKTIKLSVLETTKDPMAEKIDVYAEKAENGIAAEFVNTGTDDVVANIYLGVYDKDTNRLLHIQLIDNQLIPQDDSYEHNYDITLQENQVAKLFVWQPEGMRPYCEATIIE